MGGSELIVVLIAALILFGGKRLPELARSAGKTIRDLRRDWEEIKRQIGLDLMDDIKTPPQPPKPTLPPVTPPPPTSTPPVKEP